MSFNQIRGLKQIKPIMREGRKIYIRPKKQPPSILIKNLPSVVWCKICRTRVQYEEAIEVVGGGTQGHRSFWICPKCL